MTTRGLLSTGDTATITSIQIEHCVSAHCSSGFGTLSFQRLSPHTQAQCTPYNSLRTRSIINLGNGFYYFHCTYNQKSSPSPPQHYMLRRGVGQSPTRVKTVFQIAARSPHVIAALKSIFVQTIIIITQVATGCVLYCIRTVFKTRHHYYSAWNAFIDLFLIFFVAFGIGAEE